MTTAHSHSPPSPHRATQDVTRASKSATFSQRSNSSQTQAESNSSGQRTVVAANGSAPAMASRPGTNGMTGGNPSKDETSRFATVPNSVNGDDVTSNEDEDRRPTSAPGRRNEQSSSEGRDELNPPRTLRPNKPALLRSKSEYGPRQTEEEPATPEEHNQDWGARHGFEGNYQTEQVLQLANVCTRLDALSRCIVLDHAID